MTEQLRILLVEDHDGDARLVREHLRDVVGVSFGVVREATLSGAMDALYRERFDAVLLDLTLPDSRGVRTLTRLLESTPGVPVVVLTGVDDDRIGVAALKQGAQDYLVKDEATPKRLARTLRFAIERTAATEDARRWHEQYALWIQEASDALWDWDLRKNELTYSPGWAELLGIPVDPPLRKPDDWFERVHPADAKALANVIDTHLHADEPAFATEYRVRREDGTYRWIATRGIVVFDPNKEPYRIAGSHTDASHRHPHACGLCGEDNEPNASICVGCGAALDANARRRLKAGGQLAPGTLVAERYLLDSLIDVGSSGAVYRARDESRDRVVAIKVLHSWLVDEAEQLDRFLSEGRIQLELRHPNIVTVHDVFATEDTAMIVMEYVEGATLREFVVSPEAPETPAEWIGALVPVIEAIGYAHAHDVVHRDIKPENILVVRHTDGFGLKLTDFGIAKLTRQRRRTRTGAMLGTLHYMAPEQFIDARTADHRADIYALGCTVFEMLTRRAPFEYESDFRMMTAHLSEAPETARTFNPLVSTELSAAIDKALAKEPYARWPNCAAFANALRRALG